MYNMAKLATSFKRFVLALRRPSKARNLKLMKERGETIDSFIIREARPQDIAALVDVHVTSWNYTYPFVVHKPTHQLRERQWRRLFELRENDWFCYVVQDSKGKVVGFATGHIYNEGDLPYRGQLDKIHLLRDYHRLGFGRKLMGLVAKRFTDMGINSMLLFAEAENPSIKFYDALGGQRLYDSKGNFHGGYGWSDLRILI